MRIKKLDTRGMSHILAPLLVVIAVAVVGTYVLAASHAASRIPRPALVSNANNNQIIPLVIGQVLDVKLASGWKFNLPSNNRVLVPLGVPVYSASFSEAWYRVLSPGTAVVMATQPPVAACPKPASGQASCLVLTAPPIFHVTVSATPRSVKQVTLGTLTAHIYQRTASGVNCQYGSTCPSTKLEHYQANVTVRALTGAWSSSALATHTVTSAIDGTFSVSLAPGTYLLVAQPKTGLTALEQTVFIGSGVTSVTIVYAPDAPASKPTPKPTSTPVSTSSPTPRP